MSFIVILTREDECRVVKTRHTLKIGFDIMTVLVLLYLVFTVRIIYSGRVPLSVIKYLAGNISITVINLIYVYILRYVKIKTGYGYTSYYDISLGININYRSIKCLFELVLYVDNCGIYPDKSK